MRHPIEKTAIYLYSVILSCNVCIAQADTTKRLVSETVTLSIEVQDYVEARAQLMVLIENNNGSKARSDEKMRAPDKSGHFEVHILDENIQVIADEIEALGQVVQRSVALRNDEEEYARQQEKLKEVQRGKESLTKLLSLAREKEQYSLVLAELGKLENAIAAFSNGMRDIENLNLYNRLSVNLVEPHWEPVESGEAPFSDG